MTSFNAVTKTAKVFSITGKYLLKSMISGSCVVDLKSRWACEILNHFNIDLTIKGRPALLNQSSVMLGNHISYLDIPILIACCPDVVFVSKKEVKYWPVIGNAAVKMKTIFVERHNADSRASAKATIARSLKEKNLNLIIFPSGITKIGVSPRWQKGIFEIAEENNIVVYPFRIKYSPERDCAYIDDDNLLIHMSNLFRLKKIKVTVEFHPAVLVNTESINHWKEWSEASDF